MQRRDPLSENPRHSLHKQELERLRKEAIMSFDRMLEALIEAIQAPPAAPALKTANSGFFVRLMAEVFKNDLRLRASPQDAGWGTIHRFYRYCVKVYPEWASKQTFYTRMNAGLYHLLQHDIVEKRPAKRRYGMGRSEYEFRVNPDHVEVKVFLRSSRVGQAFV